MTVRRGFALVAALWILVMLSVFALELSTGARSRRLAAANVGERAAAIAAADAGVEQTLARLDRLRRRPFTRSGATNAMIMDPWSAAPAIAAGDATVGEFRCRVSVRDPGGQLDLNRATEDQLHRLFAALRIDAAQADRAVAGIMDWRDPDDLPRLHGAERDAYLRIGSAVLPANGPFTGLGELPQVIGVTQPIFERVRPYLTVVGSGVVNVNVAERPVLLALPGFGEEAAAAVLAMRSRRERVENIELLANALSSGARERMMQAMPLLLHAAGTYTSEVVVTSDAWLPDGSARARVEALVARDPTMQVIWRRTR